MDFLCGHERKFSDFEDPDMTDVLGQDMFAPPSSMAVDDAFMTLPTSDMEQNDWFNSIFDEQSLIYNDKNLGEAANQQPSIKSEHSYSVSNLNPSSPLDVIKTEDCQSSSAIDLSQKAQLIHAAATATQPHCFKIEPDSFLMTMTSTSTTPTLTHPANILLNTSAGRTHTIQTVHASPSIPSTIHIKTEPEDVFEEQTVSMDSVIMPPTPPSSNGSDSDGSQSPHCSAPNSPQRQSPIHQSGVLILSEEEKRTLITEGYPVPSKLPLTKQEEKNLKKVRRKIKNKISAQESRRKKKEYVDALEKRVEAYNHENSDLKKKVESLESNNRSLLGQLHKLQALVAKLPQTAAASATQTGSVLMVLVLCFAVFLGGSGMGSLSLNMGYSGARQSSRALQPPSFLHRHAGLNIAGCSVPDDWSADAYATPNLKSRVLMAVPTEDWEYEVDEGHKDRKAYIQDTGIHAENQECKNNQAQDKHTHIKASVSSEPLHTVPQAHDLTAARTPSPAGETEPQTTDTAYDDPDKNRTHSSAHTEASQAGMHPDIAVTPDVGHWSESFHHTDLEAA